MRLPIRMRAFPILDGVDTRGDDFKSSLVAKRKDAEYRLGFKPDAKLRLIIKRPLNRADVEIDTHNEGR